MILIKLIREINFNAIILIFSGGNWLITVFLFLQLFLLLKMLFQKLGLVISDFFSIISCSNLMIFFCYLWPGSIKLDKVQIRFENLSSSTKSSKRVQNVVTLSYNLHPTYWIGPIVRKVAYCKTGCLL